MIGVKFPIPPGIPFLWTPVLWARSLSFASGRQRCWFQGIGGAAGSALGAHAIRHRLGQSAETERAPGPAALAALPPQQAKGGLARGPWMLGGERGGSGHDIGTSTRDRTTIPGKWGAGLAGFILGVSSILGGRELAVGNRQPPGQLPFRGCCAEGLLSTRIVDSRRASV